MGRPNVNINVNGVKGIVPYTYKTVVLKPNIVGNKNILIQDMMNDVDTKYIIKYDYIIDDSPATGIANVSANNVSQCVNPDYVSALTAYSTAHDAWIDADNAYTNNPNQTTLAAKNAAYAAYSAAQEVLNNTPQYYYYAATAISVRKGQHVLIPDGCVLLNQTLNGLAGFEVAPIDNIVYVGSTVAGSYGYTIQDAIVVPQGCVIEFDGGSIDKGTLVGNETTIVYNQDLNKVLKSTILLGTFVYSNGQIDKLDNKNGMGKIYLRKNAPFAKQITQDNTIYVIQYDFNLNGINVTIPENCILDFEGGSLNNGILTGNSTGISTNNHANIFNNISIKGNWIVPDIYSEFFKDAEENNVLKQVFNLASDAIHNNIYIKSGTYLLSALTDTRETVLNIDKKDTDVICNGKLSLSPNSFYGYNILTLSADYVNYYGGEIEGDALNHDYSTHQDDEYATHEWGFGIAVTGSYCKIDGAKISLCTGDGICVKNDSVNNIISNVSITKCRRQGITVANTKNLMIKDFDINYIGDFTNSGVSIIGTLPKAAIDIEPDGNTAKAENITISNGVIDNCGEGIMMYRASSLNPNCNVSIDNLIINNVTSNAVTCYNAENVNINNVITDKHFNFSGKATAAVTNIQGTGNKYLIFKEGVLDVRNSLFTTVHIEGGIVNLYKTEFSFIENASDNSKELNIYDCNIYTETGTPLNLTQAVGTMKLYARNTRMEKNIASGSVGIFRLGGNIDFILEYCSFYNRNNQVTFTMIDSLGKVTLKDCVNYRWIDSNYTESTAYLASNDCVYAIYTGKEYQAGDTKPTLPDISKGHVFYDSTSDKPIWWTGSSWVDATGTPVA